MKFEKLLILLDEWIKEKADIEGLAIVGSYARNEQRSDSDIDVCIFCINPNRYINDTSWLSIFGHLQKMEIENWGVVDTVRAFFKDGTEVEFNFGTLDWADIPVDPGTQRVVSDGIRILYDPKNKLTELQKHVCEPA